MSVLVVLLVAIGVAFAALGLGLLIEILVRKLGDWLPR